MKKCPRVQGKRRLLSRNSLYIYIYIYIYRISFFKNSLSNAIAEFIGTFPTQILKFNKHLATIFGGSISAIIVLFDCSEVFTK